MKVVAINGSPKGQNGNTHVAVNAFLKGAEKAGAETINIFLADYEINYCKGCLSCWHKHPGHCVRQDDMSKVLQQAAGADILVLATPLYFDNISGTLKVFMDRLVVTGKPHIQKDTNNESRHIQSSEIRPPKLIMISTCGFPERSHFQVISHWIQRAARNMHTEVIGEIYVPQGSLVTNITVELKPVIDNFLLQVKNAGEEIICSGKLSTETEVALTKSLIPDELYIQSANRRFSAMTQ